MVTMERPVRPSLRLWIPGSDKTADDIVRGQIGRVKFLLGHRLCCLAQRIQPGKCKGERYDGDAHRYTNYHHGAAFEHVSVEVVSLNEAFDQLGYDLKRGAMCLIKRGSAHIPPDGKFIPHVNPDMSWRKLGLFYRVDPQTLRANAQDAAEAIALLMLDWVKVELPDHAEWFAAVQEVQIT